MIASVEIDALGSEAALLVIDIRVDSGARRNGRRRRGKFWVARRGSSHAGRKNFGDVYFEFEQADRAKDSNISEDGVDSSVQDDDGYNAQINGYMKPLFKDLHKEGMSSTISTGLSNSYLIGEIFGMLFFGFVISKIGRRTGIMSG
ncbi:hypothetical protein AC578_4761 [Pseudocercospora eumusae]|uniref:Major facilitator superfamily (MFS) profile domain-containing protein n=1 Tax=Pseudocercospora eumusae TaxID=321146 RepID=A0A139HLG4_9PEZI|nr:hypothetical protein AC578_4761 [Pseudocercospora eumusae]